MFENRGQGNLIHAVVFAAILIGFELVYTAFSYAWPFLHSWPIRGEFVLQGVGMGLVWAVLALGVGASLRWVCRGLERWDDRHLIRWALGLQVVVLLLLGVAIFVSGESGILEPTLSWALILAPIPALVFGGAARYVVADNRRGAEVGALTLFGVVFAGWFVAQYWFLIVFGGFGFDSEQAISRLVIVMGVPLAIMGAITLFSQRNRLESRWARIGVAVGCGIGLVVVHHINATMHVDDYFPVHSALTLMAGLMVWHLASEITGRLDRGIGFQGKKAVAALVVAALMASGITLWRSSSSVAGYVGAVHTVYQRAAMEWINELRWIGGGTEYYSKAIQSVRYRASADSDFPVDGEEELPSTFRAMERTTDVDRPEFENLVVILVDMKRPQDLGVYNPEIDMTPHLDRCFEDAFAFTRSYAPATNTEVSFAGIYSGTYGATRDQVRTNIDELPKWFAMEEGYNFPEVFSRAGFSTTILTDSWYHERFFSDETMAQEYRPVFGEFDRHLAAADEYDSDKTKDLRNRYHEAGGLVGQERPFLHVIHIFSHALEKTDEMDRMIGLICEELRESGRWDDTAILLTADHGVEFGDHGRTGYVRTVYDQVIRVPTLLRIPGMEGREIDELVSGIDHLPSMVDLFELDENFEVEGRSYMPAVFGEQEGRDRAIFSEKRYAYRSVAMMEGDYKLIHWATPGVYALFNLKDDPGEVKNLIDHPEYQAKFESMRSGLQEFYKERNEEAWRP